MLEQLLARRSIRRVAGFGNGELTCLMAAPVTHMLAAAVAMFAPKVFRYVADKLSELRQHQPDLAQNFSNSIFPAASINFGPQTVCYPHTDHGNAAYFWCPISAFGDYDPTKGGHLILFDLRLYVEFPPRSDCSHSVRHTAPWKHPGSGWRNTLIVHSILCRRAYTMGRVRISYRECF